jgi:methionine sulfoxide reductase heme-binding subunit
MADEATIRLLLRVTARISALFFIGAFAGRASCALWPSSATAWLNRNIKGLLLGLAASHTLHLAGIFALALTLGPRFLQEVGWVGIIGGGLVYLLIYALVISAVAPSSRLGLLSSRRFQSVALYAIWFVFATAFVGGAFHRSWLYLPFAVITIAALLIRIAGSWRTARTAAAAR